MYDFDQHAHRHTELTDAVVTVQQLGRFGLSRRARTRIDYALVYVSAQGAYEPFMPPDRPGTTRRFTAVYEVDTGIHPLSAEVRLPSDNDAHEFELSVELTWQVVDPALYVRSGCRDVPRLLIGELEQAARPVARCFPISSSAAAEESLLGRVGEGKPLGEGAGLRTDWTVRLRRDPANIEHERMLQNARHQMELQGYEAQRIAFYQHHLAQGGIQAWALHLARHPQDTKLALDSMQKNQLDLLASRLEQVKALLGKDGAEAHELRTTRQLMFEQINEALAAGPRDPSPDEAPSDPPPGYGRRPFPPTGPKVRP
ncbi:hypothetical protein [Streptomyces sp. NBC_01276]|uniref:hypothetical protein n=1 Tax=Streptomyces sp. NBC_01276 TaxID=2903808 RepID=UPI00352D6FE9